MPFSRCIGLFCVLIGPKNGHIENENAALCQRARDAIVGKNWRHGERWCLAPAIPRRWRMGYMEEPELRLAHLTLRPSLLFSLLITPLATALVIQPQESLARALMVVLSSTQRPQVEP